MKLKANLHLHTSDDPEDAVSYTWHDAVDEAQRLGFDVLAHSCHHVFIDRPEYRAYAAEHGVLCIPGVERDIEKRHVLILNADRSIESVNTFQGLAAYRANHPEAFVIAPHPFYYGDFSLKEKLEPNIRLFDAIEESWFYSKWFNRNLRAARVAERYHLPFITTSDTHVLRFLGVSYAEIDAEAKTVEAVFAAIRAKRFRNVNEPRRFWHDMVGDTLVPEVMKRLRRTLGPKSPPK